jgi:uncharacterized repeat protein (TIGR01451 family)
VISAKRVLLTLALIVVSVACLPSAAGAATPGGAWMISSDVRSPSVFTPGDSSGNAIYSVTATNVGSKAIGGKITITDFLPPGLTLNPSPTGPTLLAGLEGEDEGQHPYPCEPGPPARCIFNAGLKPYEIVYPDETLRMFVPVNVAPDAPPVVTNRVTVSGGGVAGASATTETTISPLEAPFGLQTLNLLSTGVDGAVETRAGSHPYQLHVLGQFNVGNHAGAPPENPRDIVADLPAGLVINPKATPVRCTEIQLEDTSENGSNNQCPNESAVGVAKLVLNLPEYARPGITQPVYNMVAPQGRPAEFAFNVAGLGIFIHLLGKVRSDGEVGLSSDTLDTPQLGNISGVTVDLWGDPSDPGHDHMRGECASTGGFSKATGCPSEGRGSAAFLTMPTACSGPISMSFGANSWQNPGTFVSGSAPTTDPNGTPVGVTGCDKLSFSPRTEASLSTDQAETGTAFDLNVDFPNDGLTNPDALAESMAQKAVVTLPEGVTINPSVGEGLGFCTPAQLAGEKTFSIDGEGCPSDSKIGTVHVDTPLLDNGVDGSVYLAQQDDPTTTTPGAENPFDTDIALYFVLRNAKLGVLVKQALKVIPDPKTGRLVATLEGIPQLPFSHFNFHFKEGARAALVSPAACGKYTTEAKFYPSSAPNSPKVADSSFEITKGVNGGPCPPAGLPPFHPRFEAGSLNNNAKSYSPFNMRLTRADGEQDMTKFSSILPPGVLGKLAGISKCPDSAIAVARTKTGRQEKASPSCPANSLIGHTIAGAGVGDSLTYVPGQLYLGGPYNGDPLSVISITPALAGPFDAGTVVVREALTLNPVTAEVEVDGKNSDPIPHILKGIVLKVRELRVYVDRNDFILNPTSCEESSAKATLFGAFRNVFDPSDDVPVNLATRYQAANCSSLVFKPRLSIELHGGTKRGDHPALKATVNAKPGEANIGKAVVTLPQSAFLDQAHIRTICTRVQYAANGGAGGGCPKAAQYGYARAFTPLLDEPVEGPVYLRSSNHKLPDLVAALHGIVDVDIDGRIDSFKGGIRSSFETVPDAPVTKFILNMQGGKKGLVVNSRNLCAGTNRGLANFTGQNGAPYNFQPVVKPSCRKAKKHKRHPKS